MKSISRAYKQICTEKYQKLGFFKNKLTFVKAERDVLQSFTLKLSYLAPKCTVDFGFFPLCMGSPVLLEAGGYELNKFAVELYREAWAFNSKSKESVISCVESISQAIDMYLLPLFEKCRDCKSALPELIKIEELFDSNRKELLRLSGERDCATPLQERSLFDYRKYYMALKSHDFSYAQRFLSHMVEHHEKKLKSFNDSSSPRQPESVVKGYITQLELLKEHLERLNSGDDAFFDELLQLNESEMLKYIKSKYPKIQINEY